MSVRREQENVNPRTQSKSPSDRCMVLREPSSVQSFPGMEHDRGLYNGLSQQDISPNGISEIITNPNVYEDKKEKEIVPQNSDVPEHSPNQTQNVSTTIPPVDVVTDPRTVQNATLSPLHINISERSEASAAPSRESEISSNGSIKQRGFQYSNRSSRDFPVQRPTSSLSSAPVVMGPPTSNSGAQILLSPAGNLHNGFQRMSSGDSAPSSPGLHSRMPKGFVHPLVAQRPQRLPSSSTYGPTITIRPGSSATSPQNTRKEHEMTRRRALVDRIARSKNNEFVHLLPRAVGLTTTQTSILLRKNRGTLQQYGMPYSMQQMIDCGAAPDKTNEIFVKKIKDANSKRTSVDDVDELTDLSDVEDNIEEMYGRTDVKMHKGGTWTMKKIDYAGVVKRVDSMLEEKRALLGMLHNQKMVMDKSCGVRFEGEELITRRRRQLNGMFYLYDKSPLLRIPGRNFGCSRMMPIQSWTSRKTHQNVFDAKDDETQPVLTGKSNTNPGEKWVATAQHNIVSHLVNGEKREVAEYDYEEYRIGEGWQQINELSFKDPINSVSFGSTNPFANRAIEYLHRVATCPSNVTRTKFDKASFYETDVRKRVADKTAAKVAAAKKKTRKRQPEEQLSSDDEASVTTKSHAVVKKRTPRGRPSTGPPKKKYQKPLTAADMDPKNGIYMDYLFEDLADDICLKFCPTKQLAYAKITCPGFHRHSEDLWDQPESGESGESAIPESFTDPHQSAEPEPFIEPRPFFASVTSDEDLYMTVAKQHYRLKHIEALRQAKDRKSRRMSKQKAAQSNVQLDAEGVPPFDMGEFEPRKVFSPRKYSSVAEPFQRRDFLNNPPVTLPVESPNQ